MNVIIAILKFVQVGASLAPIIQQLPAEAAALERILKAATRAMQRGVEGAAFLQTLGAQLEELHAQGKTITQIDLDALLGDISDTSAQIEAERRKLDPPTTPPADEGEEEEEGELTLEGEDEPEDDAAVDDSAKP